MPLGAIIIIIIYVIYVGSFIVTLISNLRSGQTRFKHGFYWVGPIGDAVIQSLVFGFVVCLVAPLIFAVFSGDFGGVVAIIQSICKYLSGWVIAILCFALWAILLSSIGAVISAFQDKHAWRRAGFPIQHDGIVACDGKQIVFKTQQGFAVVYPNYRKATARIWLVSKRPNIANSIEQQNIPQNLIDRCEEILLSGTQTQVYGDLVRRN